MADGLGLAKDSLWSRDAGPADLFRCESIRLQTHWVLVVMDQFTRRLIGFAVQVGAVDGQALCRMFNSAISKQGEPKHLSSDNDPLFQYHQWQANLRILDVEKIKTVPFVPFSHPFVERLIGTVRAGASFWTTFFSGMRPICSASSMISAIITMLSVSTHHLMASHR